MTFGKLQRLRISIRGAVQGVGFRPFIYRLATGSNLTGWVMNASEGVFIEVEGMKETLESFLLRIEREKPPHSFIQSLEFSFLDPIGFTRFEIRESDHKGGKTTLVLPDIATCSDCVHDIFDFFNRRYLYPFTNCTNCGPRFTIIESLPYDRPNTSMKAFMMCAACRSEYENPLDRRFHAQPNACPTCGPHLELWNPDGNSLATHHEALLLAAQAIRSGEIVAIKGVGGFHLMVDARNGDAVRRLRHRKHREEKPFALMYPSLVEAREDCIISQLEERLLLSSESPLVLLQRQSSIFKSQSPISSLVAPNNPFLGIMLPYTPLHHILIRELGFPVVATSGNISDEPICTDEYEALERLYGIANLFLVHDRRIVRHVDDSIVRIMMDRELILRRARGYAPLPITIAAMEDKPVLAVGAHLKNTVAITSGTNVFISQHIGDLETKQSLDAFKEVIEDFQQMYDVKLTHVVSDLHPNYLSTQFAQRLNVPLLQVQHHYAHVAACMAENQLEGEVLGVSWDGTGYGPDGTIWGGEFLATTSDSYERVATFRTFQLPGGEKAVREPRRTALGVLYELGGGDLFDRTGFRESSGFTEIELRSLGRMLAQGINAPRTSSVGRLFDAVASIIGLRQRVNFEGQAAMELEFALAGVTTEKMYEFSIENSPVKRTNTSLDKTAQSIIDWESIVLGILDDVHNGVSIGHISAAFHNTLVEIIVKVAKQSERERIVLTGGCFQNKYLTERTVRRLEAEGFKAYWHQRVPPNDGGISLGQIFAASRMNYSKSEHQASINMQELSK